MFKKLLAAAGLCLLVLAFGSLALYANDIDVTIDGVPVVFADQQPQIVDGRTFVPVRGVFYELGFDVSWDGALQAVTLSRPGDVVVITIGNAAFTRNGATHMMDVPAQMIGGSTMLPIRDVLASVGYELGWNAATSTVLITTPIPLDPAAFAQSLFALINNQRIAAGLLPLAWDEDIAFFAQFQADSGNTAGGNLTAGWNRSIENVSPQTIMDGWMNNDYSRGHLMNPDAYRAGVGFAKFPPRGTNPNYNTQAAVFLATPTGIAPGANPMTITNALRIGSIPISNITIPTDRLPTAAERQAWIDEYNAMGGANAFELEIVRLVNELRASRGLNLLEFDETAAMAARYYTQIVIHTGYTTPPSGITDPRNNAHNQGPYGGSRATALAFGFNRTGNAAFTPGPATPRGVVDGWYNSGGHRGAMMNPSLRYIGIGMSVDDSGRPFYYLLTSTLPSGDEHIRLP